MKPNREGERVCMSVALKAAPVVSTFFFFLISFEEKPQF